MLIIRDETSPTSTSFEDLVPGKIFKCVASRSVYLKVESSSITSCNAVNLTRHTLCVMPLNEEVIPLNNSELFVRY